MPPGDVSAAPQVSSVASLPTLAIVSLGHPSVSKGGAETAAYTLFNGLRQLGRRVLLICAVSRQDQSRFAPASADERAVFYDPVQYDWFYQLGYPDLWNQLRRILVAENVRLVNMQHYLHFGLGTVRALAAEPGITTVLTLHEYLPICAHDGQMVTRPGLSLCEEASPSACRECFPERSIGQFVQRRELFLDALSSVQGLIAPSRFLAGRLRVWGLGRDVTVVENALDRPQQMAAPRSCIPNAPWTFGYFGQINRFKGAEVLLGAARLVSGQADPPLQIRLHGTLARHDEAFARRFEAAIEGSALATWSGAYLNRHVGSLMAACDYVVVPSIWWENSPVVIQEAYAARRPVICSGIGGMAEKVIDGVTGLHVRPNDPADLARVLRLAADDQVHARLCENLPMPDDAATMARNYLAVFDSALARA
jgi:glycosyltransferase involved in cell wall biosynthesis